MTRKLCIAAAGLVLALGMSAGSAQAQSNRTFVSGLGADTGTCGVGAPCRSFTYAITQTNAGGEIVVLTSAGYGAVTINKAISITNKEGVEAAITITSGDGITVAAGAGDIVNLTGITLTGSSGSGNGITFTSGGFLNIKDCVARGFGNGGINLTPAASSTVTVTDTIVSNNAFFGIMVGPTGAGTTTHARFERVQAMGNSMGIEVRGDFGSPTIQATATNSDASGNGNGFFAAGNALTTFTVANSTAANNSNDGIAANGATIFLAGSIVSGNATGFAVGAGAIKTYGNNNITDTTNTGTLTKVGQQ